MTSSAPPEQTSSRFYRGYDTQTLASDMVRENDAVIQGCCSTQARECVFASQSLFDMCRKTSQFL